MRLLFATLALFALGSCSSAPPEAKKTTVATAIPEPVTALKAFYRVYSAARMWSPDVMPLRMESMPVEGITAKDGKFGAWRVTFSSMAKGKIKVFTYAVVEASATLHEGVFSVGEDRWSGPTLIEQPFYVQAFKIDSDAALKIAQEKSAEYVRNNPNRPVFMRLEFTKLYPEAAWRVLWGESLAMSDHSIYVSAGNGRYLGKS